MGSNPTPGTRSSWEFANPSVQNSYLEHNGGHKMVTECYGCSVARGSVYRRSGGWAFRVDGGIHPDSGKRRQIRRQGFATKKQAEAALADLLTSAANNTVVARSSMRLGEYLESWLGSQPARIRETTLRSYEIAVQRIVRRLGPVLLQALTPLQIERFYAELLADGVVGEVGWQPKTVRNTHVVLRKALADAERLGLVARNAAAAAHAADGTSTRVRDLVIRTAADVLRGDPR